MPLAILYTINDMLALAKQQRPSMIYYTFHAAAALVIGTAVSMNSHIISYFIMLCYIMLYHILL